MMNIPTTVYRSSISIITRTRRQAATTVLSASTASCSSRVMATVTSSSSTSPIFPEEVKTTTLKRQQQHLRTRTSSSSSLQRNIGDETWNELTNEIEPYITTTRDREVLQRSLRKLGLLNEMILKPGL
mmetsp:Transcript_20099/g.22241  ORF Transcript_20099/g.22241 Transcript_20099/m.22241 type:complete len:128 (+) Transcript_20099:94-477(+)|eukprot:CAMPEP_0170791486 /NCGR_PEP_ID=MMETSP0733-20121128/21177_1 /TAXON_ID=186038 /ORGANISM="Fragilariopsis kerguelensis, Strain L26-C5" /LENGTH=127 /DNA_ID=CAMNT_0011139433 /DNA_START=73 /DNA_END=456 /DNA_ORIENTATION=-